MDLDELLTRGVDKIYPSKDILENIVKSGKKLTLYMGFDPTGDKLHVGHMVGLMKLSQWQKLGHHVIFLIGVRERIYSSIDVYGCSDRISDG